VGNWCEEDCGVAFRHLLQYPIPDLECDFCSDLFSPFADSDIPCVKSGKKVLDRVFEKTFIRNNQKCTDVDYKIADNLIVVWDPSDAKFTSGYSNSATIARTSLLKYGYDINVDVPAWGSGQRKCRPCPPGTYISKNRANPQFKQIECKLCPAGMISARPTDNPKLFIPQDVQDMTKEQLPNIKYPSANYNVFGCRACSKLDGVPVNNVCTQCQSGQYQHAELVSLGYVWVLEIGTELKLIMATSCQYCPIGYEYYNHRDKGDKTPCRSLDGVRDCCRICQPNSFSTGNGARCTAVDKNKATKTPYGASEQYSCAVGEELVYCESNLCRNAEESRSLGWRTCRSCSYTETTRADMDIAGVCKACASEKKDLGDKTKMGSFVGGFSAPVACKQCSTCARLSLAYEEKVLHVIEANQERRNSIVYWESGKQIELLGFTYLTLQQVATCTALGRRTITNNIFDSDVDEYRPILLKHDIAPVPDYHTLVRHKETSGNCTLTRCADVCRTTRFYYSPGCGQQETDLTKIWVLYNNLLQQYNTLSNVQKQQELYVHHGPCQMCKPCFKGEYNGMCNVHMSGVNPLGTCQACLTQCPVGFFMYHSDKEAGCHVPPEIYKHTDQLWKITENYVCEKCPTWVRDNDKIYTVTACGITEKYVGWSWDANSNLVKTEKDVIYSDEKNGLKELGQSFKNYRHFLRDIVAYCPAAYFYDERVSGCSFSQQQSSIYTIPGTAARTVSIGYSTYNPNCCKPCTTCSHFKKKDTSNWKACMGDSVVNTQDFCLDRCGAMYWENVTARECRRCSTCDSGFLDMISETDIY
jgi:hypothetical protein